MPVAGDTITVAVTVEGEGSGKFPQTELYRPDTGLALTESPLSLTYVTATTEDYTGNFVFPTGATAVQAITRSYDDASFTTQTFATGVAVDRWDVQSIDVSTTVSVTTTVDVNALPSHMGVIGLVSQSATVIGLVGQSSSVVGLVDA